VTGGLERFEQLLNPALGQNHANVENYDQHDGGYVFIQGVAAASKGLTKFARTLLPQRADTNLIEGGRKLRICFYQIGDP